MPLFDHPPDAGIFCSGGSLDGPASLLESGTSGRVPRTRPMSSAGCIEVDDGMWPPVCEDEVVGREVIVADHFVGTRRGLFHPRPLKDRGHVAAFEGAYSEVCH
jgi:hypothetical protein